VKKFDCSGNTSLRPTAHASRCNRDSLNGKKWMRYTHQGNCGADDQAIHTQITPHDRYAHSLVQS
jgi:hypothetical protein